MQARVRFHVLLSTYEMVLGEAAELKRISWASQVVDEGHRLRNRHSKAFQVRSSPLQAGGGTDLGGVTGPSAAAMHVLGDVHGRPG